MFVFRASLITGMMVGIEFYSAPATKAKPAHFSTVLDLFIVRFVFQKYTYVR